MGMSVDCRYHINLFFAWNFGLSVYSISVILHQVSISLLSVFICMQQNVVLYAFPWYQPQLEPRKQFGKYTCTSWRRGRWKERGGTRRGGRREEGRESRRGEIPPSAADDCLTSVHMSRAHDDIILLLNNKNWRHHALLHLYVIIQIVG